MMPATCVVTIGRNVGTSPMGADDWARFRSAVASVFSVTFGTFDGVGRWTDDATGAEVVEDSHAVVGVVDDVDLARLVLAAAADAFGQDGVGFVVNAGGTDSVVHRERVAVAA
jgi:hypothetical protein